MQEGDGDLLGTLGQQGAEVRRSLQEGTETVIHVHILVAGFIRKVAYALLTMVLTRAWHRDSLAPKISQQIR